MSNATNYTRERSKYFATRQNLLGTDLDLDLAATRPLFKSENYQSTNYDATYGLDDGTRYNVRINPETSPVFVKFNDSTNDAILVPADTIFEEFNVRVRNIYLTSADQSTTSQIDHITFGDDTAGSQNNNYVKLYTLDNNLVLTVYGIWLNVDSGGTQPTDAEVDTWLEVGISAGDTGTQIAAAAETVVDGETGILTSTPTAAVLAVTHTIKGPRTAPVSSSVDNTVSIATPGAGVDTLVNILVR